MTASTGFPLTPSLLACEGVRAHGQIYLNRSTRADAYLTTVQRPAVVADTAEYVLHHRSQWPFTSVK